MAVAFGSCLCKECGGKCRARDLTKCNLIVFCAVTQIEAFEGKLGWTGEESGGRE